MQKYAVEAKPNSNTCDELKGSEMYEV